MNSMTPILTSLRTKSIKGLGKKKIRTTVIIICITKDLPFEALKALFFSKMVEVNSHI